MPGSPRALPSAAEATAVPNGFTRRSAFRLLGGAAAGAVLLNAGSDLLAPVAAYAATVVPQAGAVPFPITQGVTTDVTTVLLAASAAHTSDMQMLDPTEGRKNFYMEDFLTTSDYLSWQVSVTSTESFEIYACVDAQPSQQLTVTATGASSGTVTAATASTTTWQRLPIGQLTLDAGTSTLTLTRTGTLSDDLYVKSLELIPASQLTSYQSAVAAARADTSWFGQSPYGLMFQYGSWGFPNNAGPAKSLTQQANDFNVDAFMSLVTESGASYVVWSFSWWGYHVDAPVTQIDTIVTAAGGPASPGLTASRDLIGEIATACQNAGVRFLLYYHTGDEDSAWWPYQDFPTEFSADGSGDRSTFLNNWVTVLTALGNRYGTKLDGYFFDDGVIYYPAPFQALEQAARTGNPNRLISWSGSPIGGLNVTDFQDVYFGESSQGQSQLGSAPVGANGVFTGGPATGLLQHGMFILDADWGVHTQGQKITPDTSLAPTSNKLIGWIADASSRSVPVSIDLMMYEDGTVADVDRRMLVDLRQAVHGTVPAVPTGAVVVNNTDPGITYTGSWSLSSGRGYGDYDADVQYTTTNGDSFSYTFTGTGIDYISEKNSDEGQIEIYVDGVLITTVNASSSSRQAQQVLYGARHLTPGQHTFKAVKTSGTYMLLDALRVVPNPTMVNDTDASISYDGTWTYTGNRGAGDYDNDVHYTAANGGTATITFTGTGIDYIGPMESQDGTANVILDGVQVGTTSASYSGAYTAQQFLYQVRDLTPATHTLQLVKTGGTYVQIDAFQIWP
ncbi:alpha-L-fucosidase [Actinospica durhamensis]|uniref:alpha-L-fucosidase n=1 Tax=Actinospica durhamensis TaxID=1508375 RepID=A0A941IPN4_9ACTN|nr:alpha-L-fucosidase [Actinospica durhamensis]MBR7832123.1 alpha-L-fucosidase [Actinospica durhamensis]